MIRNALTTRRVLWWLVVAIVLAAVVAVVEVFLSLAEWLLHLAVPALLVLLLCAVGLRFWSWWREDRSA